MRRLAPRALADALERVVPEVAPATVLARVQQAWPEVAGERLVAVASPVSERDGVVTFACESGVWAQELDLLGDDLLSRLGVALEAPLGSPRNRASGPLTAAPKISKLRFVVGSEANRS